LDVNEFRDRCWLFGQLTASSVLRDDRANNTDDVYGGLAFRCMAYRTGYANSCSPLRSTMLSNFSASPLGFFAPISHF